MMGFMTEQITFDDRDAALLQDRMRLRAELQGPHVGDWVWMHKLKQFRRFTHNWGDGIQTTHDWGNGKCDGGGGFHIFKDGTCSYSGGLDRSIPKNQITGPIGYKQGMVWFFHHDWVGAHRGVWHYADFPIFEYHG